MKLTLDTPLVEDTLASIFMFCVGRVARLIVLPSVSIIMRPPEVSLLTSFNSEIELGD